MCSPCNSLDEDRIGDELSVNWELEVGGHGDSSKGLPESIRRDGFNDPANVGRFRKWDALMRSPR